MRSAILVLALGACATPATMTRGEHIGGAVTAGVVGFGTGQAIQGRWTSIGWVFTAGELAASVALGIGGSRIASHCPAGEASGCDDAGPALAITGALVLAAFRAWGVLDAIFVGRDVVAHRNGSLVSVTASNPASPASVAPTPAAFPTARGEDREVSVPPERKSSSYSRTVKPSPSANQRRLAAASA